MLLGFFVIGAGDEVRTRDIQLGRLTLYQLSYSRSWYDVIFLTLQRYIYFRIQSKFLKDFFTIFLLFML